MFTLSHATLLLLSAFAGWWLWRSLGQRDQALARVRQHCERADVQLLDDSVALSAIRIGRNRRGMPGLIRRYGFEFTVTGEHRYSGHLDLHGLQVLKIELAPHPFPGGDNPAESCSESASRPGATIHRIY
ncbi:DUF3301 domain-containing protein [Halopseudomonas pachastrellae]|uniref:DUF3301 domain-containing protein n=1 Tax=Halopseudomonas pachastrellae TaxID=254161 RepID=UPI003D7EE608